MSSVRSYTIDLSAVDNKWQWRLYTVGGTVRLTEGKADSIEQASSDARTAMIVHDRGDQ
jgi:hypothetical protein